MVGVKDCLRSAEPWLIGLSCGVLIVTCLFLGVRGEDDFKFDFFLGWCGLTLAYSPSGWWFAIIGGVAGRLLSPIRRVRLGVVGTEKLFRPFGLSCSKDLTVTIRFVGDLGDDDFILDLLRGRVGVADPCKVAATSAGAATGAVATASPPRTTVAVPSAMLMLEPPPLSSSNSSYGIRLAYLRPVSFFLPFFSLALTKYAATKRPRTTSTPPAAPAMRAPLFLLLSSSSVDDVRVVVEKNAITARITSLSARGMLVSTKDDSAAPFVVAVNVSPLVVVKVMLIAVLLEIV